MQRHLMKSKIHRATITSADLHYETVVFVDAGKRIVRPPLRAER